MENREMLALGLVVVAGAGLYYFSQKEEEEATPALSDEDAAKAKATQIVQQHVAPQAAPDTVSAPAPAKPPPTKLKSWDGKKIKRAILGVLEGGTVKLADGTADPTFAGALLNPTSSVAELEAQAATLKSRRDAITSKQLARRKQIEAWMKKAVVTPISGQRAAKVTIPIGLDKVEVIATILPPKAGSRQDRVTFSAATPSLVALAREGRGLKLGWEKANVEHKAALKAARDARLAASKAAAKTAPPSSPTTAERLKALEKAPPHQVIEMAQFGIVGLADAIRKDDKKRIAESVEMLRILLPSAVFRRAAGKSAEAWISQQHKATPESQKAGSEKLIGILQQHRLIGQVDLGDTISHFGYLGGY